MSERMVARVRCDVKPLRWLLDPAVPCSDNVRGVLLGQLLSSPMAVVLGAGNAGLVATVGIFRLEAPIFIIFVCLEICILTLRLFAIARAGRMRRAGKIADVGLSVFCSLLWCTLQGSLSFTIMISGDTVLMILSATLIMGIVAPICARNYPAPRLALLLVCLCDLPFKAGAALSGDPWLLVLLPMTPPFFLGAMQIVRSFQKTLVSALAAEHRSDYLARHDILTGLLNRQGFEDALFALPGESTFLAVLGGDLDGFKRANDQYGHAAGDILLQEVAARLNANVRQGDLVSRIGGDEFTIVVSGLQPDDVAGIAERLISCISDEPFHINGNMLHLGMSIGFACYPEDGTDIQQLRVFADEALYDVKRGGKGHAKRSHRAIIGA